MKNAFVIMTNTLFQGDIIGCHDGDDGHPSLFETAIEAWKEIADDKIEELRQFIEGDRELDETDFSFEEWVIPVTVHEGGVICAEEYDILFDPKVPHKTR